MTALLTPNQIVRLKDNGKLSAQRGERLEFPPVAKIVAHDRREWLLLEIDPEDGDLVFAEFRRPGRKTERLWLHLSWLQRQEITRTQRFGRVRKVAA